MSDRPKNHRAPVVTQQTSKKRLQTAFATRFETYRSRSLAWRLLVPVVFVLAGALFVTSAISSGGTDLRAGGATDLDSLTNRESRNLEQLRGKAADLTERIDQLSAGLGSSQVKKLQAQVDALSGPAGLDAAQGPGVTVTLDDAPEESQKSADTDPNDLVVHQQDIQAVANALWAGGAEAMTIQGQRVVSTTGIKCVGNTVRLHGVPYAPPYVLSAIGDQNAMLQSINTSPYISIYLQYVARWDLGWNVDVETELNLPSYEGSTELSYARPAGNSGTTAGGTDNGT